MSSTEICKELAARGVEEPPRFFFYPDDDKKLFLAIVRNEWVQTARGRKAINELPGKVSGANFTSEDLRSLEDANAAITKAIRNVLVNDGKS